MITTGPGRGEVAMRKAARTMSGSAVTLGTVNTSFEMLWKKPCCRCPAGHALVAQRDPVQGQSPTMQTIGIEAL